MLVQSGINMGSKRCETLGQNTSNVFDENSPGLDLLNKAQHWREHVTIIFCAKLFARDRERG